MNILEILRILIIPLFLVGSPQLDSAQHSQVSDVVQVPIAATHTSEDYPLTVAESTTDYIIGKPEKVMIIVGEEITNPNVEIYVNTYPYDEVIPKTMPDYVLQDGKAVIEITPAIYGPNQVFFTVIANPNTETEEYMTMGFAITADFPADTFNAQIHRSGQRYFADVGQPYFVNYYTIYSPYSAYGVSIDGDEYRLFTDAKNLQFPVVTLVGQTKTVTVRIKDAFDTILTFEVESDGRYRSGYEVFFPKE